MNGFALPPWMKTGGAQALAAPALIILMLAMMVLPLPAFALDLLFSFNIALSIIILMTSLYTVKPLDFMAFPAVLLVSTMLRLSLNVASTRVVLTEGHAGGAAAGQVIEAFGHFLIGGNYTVGIVVFVILTIINFTVVTKGAGRIAEVGARFALDAMPGKQMAIDADLNAGLIGEADARARRTEVAREAEFYGAMDGASKYVRGDAVAGIVVTVVNVVGGLVVGLLQHDMAFADALKNYTLLAKPQVLGITAAIIGGFGIVPGMPHVPFLLLAVLLAYGARQAQRRLEKPKETDEPAVAAPAATAESEEAGWQDVVPVDALGLEVGFRLIPLVDAAQGGELLKRIKGVRRKFAQDIGFLAPPVHIRDNLELRPGGYRITLKGVEIGAGEAHASQFLAIDPGMVSGPLDGARTTDPAFGLPAVWIEEGQRAHAQALGYTVVDASTVIATHLNHLVSQHAAELLGRIEVQQLVEHVEKETPKLLEDLVPKQMSLSALQKVLQNLLNEGVHIRDMRTIVETLCEHASRISDPAELTELVRGALGRAIVQQLFPAPSELSVITLDAQLERVLMTALQAGGAAIEPGLADTLSTQAEKTVKRQEQSGLTPVLLVPAPLRPLLSRFLRRALPQLAVLSHAEVPESRMVRVTGLIGAQ